MSATLSTVPATRTAGGDVSTSMARHSRVNSSTTVSARNTRPRAVVSRTKSTLHRTFGPLGTGRGTRARATRLRRRVLRHAAVVAATLVVSGFSLACGAMSSPDAAVGPSAAGTWALQSIGATPLPVVTSYGGHGSDTLVGDTLVFAADGTATSAAYVYVVFAYPGLPSRNDTTAIRSTGTWHQQGAVISSVWHVVGTSDTVVQTAMLTSAGRLASVGGIGYRYGSTGVGDPQPPYAWTRAR